MPSAYTETITDSTTLKDFTMVCARAMGQCSSMAGQPLSTPIPEEFQPSDYHLRQIKELENSTSKLLSMSDTQLQSLIDDKYDADLAAIEDRKRANRAKRRNNDRLLADVLEWLPPTLAHSSLKNFMVKQLTQEIEDYYSDELPPEPKKTIEEYRSSKLAYYEQCLSHHKEGHLKEIERTNRSNVWLKQLRESL